MSSTALLLVMLVAAIPPLLAWETLTPPSGNSLAIKTKTRNGRQVYRCEDGNWLLDSAYASVVNFDDAAKVVGNYSWTKNAEEPLYSGIWYLLNNAGDVAESGDVASSVAGRQFSAAKPTSPQNLEDFLAVASSHKNGGEASLVSYIARVNTKGGVPINDGACQYEGKVITQPFQAEFHFWKQDLVPPLAPSAITVVVDRAVQGVYGTGVVTYTFDGSSWTQKGTRADLYDVPGGNKVGSFSVLSTPDYRGGTSCWHFDDPNGFEVVGKSACPPVSVTPSCLPWALTQITTSSQKSRVFGDYTHVQMVSTTGGLAPSGVVPVSKSGQVYESPFTAIYWFYCKSLI